MKEFWFYRIIDGVLSITIYLGMFNVLFLLFSDPISTPDWEWKILRTVTNLISMTVFKLFVLILINRKVNKILDDHEASKKPIGSEQ